MTCVKIVFIYQKLSSMTNVTGVQGDSSALDALLQEYKECEERIRSHEKEDPLILYYVKQSRLKSIEDVIKRHSEATETLRKRVTDELNKDTKNGAMTNRTLRSSLIRAGDAAKLPKADQELIAKQNQLVRPINSLLF